MHVSMVNISKTITVRDSLSDVFAENVADELNKKWGFKPFFIIGKWNSVKVDFNREINEATLNHPEPIAAHHIHRESKNEAEKKYPNFFIGMKKSSIPEFCEAQAKWLRHSLISPKKFLLKFSSIAKKIEESWFSVIFKDQKPFSKNVKLFLQKMQKFLYWKLKKKRFARRRNKSSAPSLTSLPRPATRWW